MIVSSSLQLNAFHSLKKLCIGANLAYVKHFGKKADAVHATFKSLNSKGFIVEYEKEDGSKDEVFIEYNASVTKREDVRPVLEEMAKEAEAALGMVNIQLGVK
jgi:hypothetical protein